MCWEMDYEYFAQLEKAKNAEKAQEKRAGVIDNLLTDANAQAEKSHPKWRRSTRSRLRNNRVTTML